MPNPRESLKPDAPRISKYQIDVDKIGLLIGPGGKTIKGISEESGAVIDINDDGIEHRLGRELKLKGKYETLQNGSVRVYAELA